MIVDLLAGAVPDADAVGLAEAVTRGRLRSPDGDRAPGAAARRHEEVLERWQAARERASVRAPSEQEFFAALDTGGIGLAGVYTELVGSRLGVPTAGNHLVAEFAGRHAERIVGFAGVDPWEPDAARSVEAAVRDLGLAGVVLSPYKQQLPPGDPRMTRVYGRCEALGVPLILHAGIHWSLDSPYDIGHPRHLDAIACAFPDLRLVARHCAWPWVADMMIVAWRHPNVYVELSAQRPGTFAQPNSGWDALLRHGTRQLADRVLFASAWTEHGVPPGELVTEIRGLPIEDEVADRWLGGNALRLLGRG